MNKSKPKKENDPTLQEVMIRAIENWYQYGLIDKETYKIHRKVWE